MINFEELRISAQTVTSLFPALKNVPVVRCWAGIEGMMPDQLPVISPSSKASGIFHAIWFFRSRLSAWSCRWQNHGRPGPTRPQLFAPGAVPG